MGTAKHTRGKRLYPRTCRQGKYFPAGDTALPHRTSVVSHRAKRISFMSLFFQHGQCCLPYTDAPPCSRWQKPPHIRCPRTRKAEAFASAFRIPDELERRIGIIRPLPLPRLRRLQGPRPFRRAADFQLREPRSFHSWR